MESETWYFLPAKMQAIFIASILNCTLDGLKADKDFCQTALDRRRPIERKPDQKSYLCTFDKDSDITKAQQLQMAYTSVCPKAKRNTKAVHTKESSTDDRLTRTFALQLWGWRPKQPRHNEILTTKRPTERKSVELKFDRWWTQPIKDWDRWRPTRTFCLTSERHKANETQTDRKSYKRSIKTFVLQLRGRWLKLKPNSQKVDKKNVCVAFLP